MAIQDNFIGNLRNAKVSGDLRKGGFVDALRSSMGQQAAPNPSGVQNEPMTEPRTVVQQKSAETGSRYLSTPNVAKNSAYNTIEIAALPQTEKDWDAFMSNVDDFRSMLDVYSKEPDQNKRIDLLEKNKDKFSQSGRLARYLYVMSMDEQTNKDGGYPGFDYTQVKPGVEKAIDDIISFRFKKA